jgi:hypothetical protein
MESLKIQIMDDAGQPAYEQRVFFKTDAELIDILKKVGLSTHTLEPHAILQLKPGIKIPGAVDELKHAVSRSTNIYDYDALAVPTELYHLLTPTLKKMLYALAFYSTEDAAYMSGYSYETIRSMRKDVYPRTGHECMADLRTFCNDLEKAGIVLDKDPRK